MNERERYPQWVPVFDCNANRTVILKRFPKGNVFSYKECSGEELVLLVAWANSGWEKKDPE